MKTTKRYRNRYDSAQMHTDYKEKAEKSRAKASKSGKKCGIFKQIVSVMVIVIVLGLLAKAMFSSVPVEKVQHIVEPGDTVSTILDSISTQAKQEHDLARLRTSVFAEVDLFEEWVVIYPGDILEVEVSVTPLGVITKTGVINYHYHLIEHTTR